MKRSFLFEGTRLKVNKSSEGTRICSTIVHICIYIYI